MSNLFLQTGFVDYIIHGEGEITITNLLLALMSNLSKDTIQTIKGLSFVHTNGNCYKTPPQPSIKNLDELPLPDRDAFHWKKYPQWSIITSRGCPYSCAFCSSSEFWQHKIRYRSAKSIYSELEQLSLKYGVHNLYILDDTFGANRVETSTLLEKLCYTDFKLQWACLTRAELTTNKILDLYKRSGCVQIHFGLESASVRTQAYIRKNLDLVQLERSVKFCKEIGIRTKLSVIFGLPHETETELYETIDFLLALQPDEVQIYPLMPYIGIDVLNDKAISLLSEGNHEWKQDALIPLAKSNSISTQQQIAITMEAIEAFRNLGYKWIPIDANPEKQNMQKIIKTVFAPIQGLEKE